MLDRRHFLAASAAAAAFRPSGVAFAADLTVSSYGLVFLDLIFGARRATALVDTGSVQGLQMTEALAAELKLALSDTGRVTQRYQGGGRPILGGQVPRVAAADHDFGAAEVRVSPGDIEAIAAQVGTPFEAIIGWPLLSSAPFSIDYRQRRLTFAEAPAGALALPLDPALPLPVTAGTVAGKPATLLIDTGAPVSNLDPSLAGGAKVGDQLDLPVGLGGRALNVHFRIKDLTAMSRGLGAHAVLGHRFLKDYRLVWQPSARALSLGA